MALPKSHRLSLRFERDRLTKTGETSYGKFFTFVSSNTPEDKDLHSPRFAILLSKKTAHLATERNKIKRITSDILELSLASIPAKDYLVIPKRQVLLENFSTLVSDLKSLFDK